MAQTYREVRHTAVKDRAPEVTDEYITSEVRPDATSVAARIVSLIGGIIMGLLAIRFVLSLLGANRNNAFADFIYTVSYPFAAPFFGLFNYQPQFGRVRFEFETLVAIAVWGLVTWIIIQLVTIPSRD